jgi:hypothetical protein
MAAAAVSPELALVDPELRDTARLMLPRVEPFDFLSFSKGPRRHPDLDLFGFLAESDEAERLERVPGIWVAAAAYAAFALARAVVLDLVLVLGVAGAVALTQLG